MPLLCLLWLLLWCYCIQIIIHNTTPSWSTCSCDCESILRWELESIDVNIWLLALDSFGPLVVLCAEWDTALQHPLHHPGKWAQAPWPSFSLEHLPMYVLTYLHTYHISSRHCQRSRAHGLARTVLLLHGKSHHSCGASRSRAALSPILMASAAPFALPSKLHMDYPVKMYHKYLGN